MSDPIQIVDDRKAGQIRGAFSYSPFETAGDARAWAMASLTRAFEKRVCTVSAQGLSLVITAPPVRLYARGQPGSQYGDSITWLRNGRLEFGGNAQTVEVRYQFDQAIDSPIFLGLFACLAILAVPIPFLKSLPGSLLGVLALLVWASVSAAAYGLAGLIISRRIETDLRDTLRAYEKDWVPTQ